MSRNQEFFHGSSHQFEVGDFIDPSFDTWGRGQVHATNDSGYAAGYGKNVYRVEPVGVHKDLSHENATVRHYVSEGGYKVLGVVEK